MTIWADLFQSHIDSITTAVADRLLESVPSYAALSRQELHTRIQLSLLPYTKDLDEATPVHFAERWSKVAFQRAQEGMAMDSFLQTLLIGTESILQILRSYVADNPEKQIQLLEKGYAITATGIAAVYRSYSDYKDTIINAQTISLAELAAPIVPIYDGILILPLIGAIDSQRASHILDGMLQTISSSGADTIIIDITGVPVIDTLVAKHLVQTAQAAKLLGTTVLLVGIRPEIAQTMVYLNIDLSNILTFANLQVGIDKALALRGLAIQQSRQ